MVAFLVDFSRACASLDDLSHVHLDYAYPGLLVGFERLGSIDIIDMELYVLAFLFVITQNECFDEFGIYFIRDNLGSTHL